MVRGYEKGVGELLLQRQHQGTRAALDVVGALRAARVASGVAEHLQRVIVAARLVQRAAQEHGNLHDLTGIGRVLECAGELSGRRGLVAAAGYRGSQRFQDFLVARAIRHVEGDERALGFGHGADHPFISRCIAEATKNNTSRTTGIEIKL